MGQVPKYTIIGDGRTARHFSYYLSLLNIPYQQWSRSSDISLNQIELNEIVLLLINDSVIEDFIRENSFLLNQCCVHFSGSLVTDLAHGMHPLMTFGSELYALSDYQNIPWIVENSAPSFSELFPDLSNISFTIDKNRKNYYHALCVMSNNFTAMLWQKFFNSMINEFQIPKKYLIPFFQKTMSNIITDHENALTGPLIRRDQLTVERNLNALEKDAFQCVYEAFVKVYCEEYSHESI